MTKHTGLPKNRNPRNRPKHTGYKTRYNTD